MRTTHHAMLEEVYKIEQENDSFYCNYITTDVRYEDMRYEIKLEIRAQQARGWRQNELVSSQ